MDHWVLQAESATRTALDWRAVKTFARGVVGIIRWSKNSPQKPATASLSTAVKFTATRAQGLESTMSVYNAEELVLKHGTPLSLPKIYDLFFI